MSPEKGEPLLPQELPGNVSLDPSKFTQQPDTLVDLESQIGSAPALGGDGQHLAVQAEYSALFSPFTPNDMMCRQAVSVILSILLVILAGIPFTPLTWVLPWKSVEVVDWVMSNFALAAACYLHFHIACLREDVVVSITPGSPGRTAVSRAFVQRYEIVPSWTWPANVFHPVSAFEFVLVGLLLSTRLEILLLKRTIAVLMVAWRLYVGWSVIPRKHKEWAWEQVKGSESG